MGQAAVVTDASAWAALCAKVFVPLDIRTDGDFSGSVSSCALGGASVVAVTNTAATVVRSRRLVRDEPADLVVVDVHLFGRGAVAGSDNVDPVGRSSIVVCNTNQPYRLQFLERSSVVAFSFSRSRLRVSDRALTSVHARALDGHGASSTVLRHLLGGVLAGGDLDQDGGAAVAEAAVALVESAVRATSEAERTVTPLDETTAYLTVCGFLRAHYDDPGLSVDVVARHHRMSRRYLEMLFAGHDETPAAYLRGLRMAHARRCLQTLPTPDVGEVAHRVGYRDVTSFIRAYRRQYQETPGVTRSRTDADSRAVASPLRSSDRESP